MNSQKGVTGTKVVNIRDNDEEMVRGKERKRKGKETKGGHWRSFSCRQKRGWIPGGGLGVVCSTTGCYKARDCVQPSILVRLAL